MLKAIIIEDERNAAALLERMIAEVSPSVDIVATCRELQEGVRKIKTHLPDIVFLDIELPVHSGMELLDHLKPEEISFQIIFTTAYNEYAIRAFEMSAAAYLLKPIEEDKLRLALDKVMVYSKLQVPNTLPVLKQNLENKASRKIVISVANGFEVINLADISYLKAEGSYTQICLNDQSVITASKNLKHFEYMLSEARHFIRVHRSYIVNASFVKRILRKDGIMLVMDNKSEVPVSEEKVEQVLELLQAL